MLLLEHAGTMSQPPQIQVFASDLGELALDYARKGIYPEAIAANVSAERLGRFFTQENSHYQVRDDLRERVLFTSHNLLQDPPFSKLDLVLCRNLLIYLQRPLQERVFEIFHYALRPDGYLFLGSAESPESITTLFEPVNKQHRIYHRSRQSQGTLVLPTLPLRLTTDRGLDAMSSPLSLVPRYWINTTNVRRSISDKLIRLSCNDDLFVRDRGWTNGNRANIADFADRCVVDRGTIY